MIGFLIGLLLGGLAGVMFMALFQINKERAAEHTEKEKTQNERDNTDD